MTFNPTIALFLFIAFICLGVLLIYLKIKPGSLRDEKISKAEATLPPAERLILSSEGFCVYQSVSPDPGQSPVYYLDIDDRIITDIRDASSRQYAGIRCVLSQKILKQLVSAVHFAPEAGDASA